MPYASRQQARWAHATDQSFAKRWDKETDFAKLPKRVKRIRSRMGLKGCTCKALATDTPQAARTIAPAAAPTAAPAKGGSLGPGITRIRGNLCNVHGKYGPCDAALSKKKPKGGKGRAAAKPKKPPKTEAQRAAEREQRAQARQVETTRQQALNLTKVSDAIDMGDDLANLDQFAQGKPLGQSAIDTLSKQGLLEIGSDGAPRKSEQANVLLNAAKRGDVQGARDAASRARDQVTKRGEQATARSERTQAAAARHAATEAKRQAAQQSRAARLAKRASAGAKKPAAQAAPSKRAARRAARGGSFSFSGGGGGSSGGGATAAPKQPAAPKPAQPPAKQIAPALHDAVTALSEGANVSAEQLQQLITNGLVKLNKDGTPVLTAAGQRAVTTKATGSPGDYLVVEDPEKPTTWHLQVRRNGKPDHGLMGGAWAALHGGYRGNTYAGPGKGAALVKLRALYASEKMPLPSEKDFTEKAQTAEDRAMFAKMGGGGGGGGGGGSGGGGSKLWPKGPSGKRTPQAAAAQSGGAGNAPPTKSAIQAHLDFSNSAAGLKEDIDWHHDAQKQTEAEIARLKKLPKRTPGQDKALEGNESALRQIKKSIPILEKLHSEAIAKKKESTFTVYKDATGADRWVSVSSTAYRDRDKEIVSTKALMGAVALADASGVRGPLRFWHVPGVDLGDCDYQATAQDGRFLIESGTFRSPALAAAVKSHADDYQLSIGFTHPPNEPDSHGVFSNIAIFERSLVPRGRASNPLTQLTLVTKESRMLTTEKQAELTRLLDGNGALLAGLLDQIATTDKAAQDGGVAYKDAPDLRALIREELASLLSETTEKAAPPMGGGMMAEGTPEEEAAESPEEEQTEMDAGAGDTADENMLTNAEISAIADQTAEKTAQRLLAELMPHLGIGQKMDEVKSMLGGMAGGYAKKDAELAAVKETLATVQAHVADLSGAQPRIMAGGYRASQAAATVTTDDRLKEAQPSADPRMAAFSDFLGELGLNQPAQPGV